MTLLYSQLKYEETQEYEIINQEEAKALGWEEHELEIGYDGKFYLQGHLPVKPQELKEEEVRAVRSQYYETYVDWYQAKPLLWEEMSETEKKDIKDYRQYLKDYTSQEGWYNQNPLNFDDWKAQR